MLSEAAVVDLGVTDRIEALAGILRQVDGATIIDLGCGEGEVARALAERGASVTGYDPFIGDADEAWTPLGRGRFRLLRGRAGQTPEPDHGADAVLFVYSLHHVPGDELGAALAEARRILKPDGQLCVVEPVAAGPMQYVSESYHDETEVRRGAMAALQRFAAPVFAREEVFSLAERTEVADFEAFSSRALRGARFNDYTAAQVTAPEVRSRFEAMATATGGVFDQPVRINLYTDPKPAHFGGRDD
jgi:ubiquinone/menaquinone biosynthesis C-methylase UbiE